MSVVRSDFRLCPKVTFSVITSHIYAYGYLASWNSFLIGIIFLSLALMERCKEAALDRLSEMSPSYQELVFCWISPTGSLKFEEYEMLECSQMAHAKGKGDGGSFWSGVIFSRYTGFLLAIITIGILLETLLPYANSLSRPTFLNMTHLNRWGTLFMVWKAFRSQRKAFYSSDTFLFIPSGAEKPQNQNGSQETINIHD